MTIDLGGRAALVTGAGSGIGRATALVLARYGARVAVAGRRLAAVEETARLVEAAGGTALPVRADVAVEDDVQAMVSATVAAFGTLDLACNNAGTLGTIRPLVGLGAEDFDAVVGTNLRGVFLCLKHELAVMAERGSGAIVTVTSVNAVRPSAGAGGYCASKAGADMLTHVAALEHAEAGIRVNVLRPGYALTPMHDEVLELSGGATPAIVAEVEGGVPMRRRGEPEEVGEAVAWLLSDHASYVTGSVVTVDGGVQHA